MDGEVKLELLWSPSLSLLFDPSRGPALFIVEGYHDVVSYLHITRNLGTKQWSIGVLGPPLWFIRHKGDQNDQRVAMAAAAEWKKERNGRMRAPPYRCKILNRSIKNQSPSSPTQKSKILQSWTPRRIDRGSMVRLTPNSIANLSV